MVNTTTDITNTCKHQTQLIPINEEFGFEYSESENNYYPVEDGDVYRKCHIRVWCVDCDKEISLKITGVIVHDEEES